jgi:hypothetical protein
LIPQDFFVENLCEKLEMLLSTAYNKNMNTAYKKGEVVNKSKSKKMISRLSLYVSRYAEGDTRYGMDDNNLKMFCMSLLNEVNHLLELNPLESVEELTDSVLKKVTSEKMRDGRIELTLRGGVFNLVPLKS